MKKWIKEHIERRIDYSRRLHFNNEHKINALCKYLGVELEEKDITIEKYDVVKKGE